MPHIKEGRRCSVCGIEFTKASYVGKIKRKSDDGYYVPKLVCQKCHNDFFSEGEK